VSVSRFGGSIGDDCVIIVGGSGCGFLKFFFGWSGGEGWWGMCLSGGGDEWVVGCVVVGFELGVGGREGGVGGGGVVRRGVGGVGCWVG